MAAQIEHKVTIQLTFSMTWNDLKRQAEAAGVPNEAKVGTYHYNAGNDPREYSYTNIIFTW